MTQTDYSKMFNCPKCGTVGSIFLVKVAGLRVIVKQKCPVHGGRKFEFPFVHLNHQMPFIQDGVYRCYKCGQETKEDKVKMSSIWTLVRCVCETHGNNLPWQKIDYSVYNMISSKRYQAPQSTQPTLAQPELGDTQSIQPQVMPIEESKICPNCGAKSKENANYCEQCGVNINPD